MALLRTVSKQTYDSDGGNDCDSIEINLASSRNAKCAFSGLMC